jgi:hypothetical protein
MRKVADGVTTTYVVALLACPERSQRGAPTDWQQLETSEVFDDPGGLDILGQPHGEGRPAGIHISTDDAVNRLTGVDDVTYTCDDNGNPSD